MSQGDGVKSCEEAFERLLNGKPNKKEHVGINLAKITPSVVSAEAGFDRGYLKKSRALHKPLIARIEASKAEQFASDSNPRELLRRAKNSAERAVQSEGEMKNTLGKVLTQNLMLVERVRELEALVAKIQPSLRGII